MSIVDAIAIQILTIKQQVASWFTRCSHRWGNASLSAFSNVRGVFGGARARLDRGAVKNRQRRLVAMAARAPVTGGTLGESGPALNDLLHLGVDQDHLDKLF